MDRDLLIRGLLCLVLVVVFLIAAAAERYVTIIGPIAAIGVAIIMFWPRRDNEHRDRKVVDSDAQE